MNADHLEAWQNYLVEQMHQQHGVAKKEAQKTVAHWLELLGQGLRSSKAQQPPEAAATRNRRVPGRVGVYLPDRSATRSRAARAQG
jgi:hypothetical protein